MSIHPLSDGPSFIDKRFPVNKVLYNDGNLTNISLTPFPITKVPEMPIFFLETEHPKDFFGRKLCAIESAAKVNPKRTVFILFNTNETIISLPSLWFQERQCK